MRTKWNVFEFSDQTGGNSLFRVAIHVVGQPAEATVPTVFMFVARSSIWNSLVRSA
jgi:hypothetical protein